MAFKDKQTRKERLSSIVSGDVRDRNRAGPSMIRLNSAATMPRYGMPVSGLRGRTPKDQSRVPVGTIDIRGYFGDEGTGSRKATPPRKIAGNPFRRDGRGGYVYEGVQLRLKSGEPMSSVDRYLEKVNKRRAATIAATKAAKNQVKDAPTVKKAAPIRTTVDMLATPATTKAKAPTRMAVNPRTGSTLGFTTGTRTGSTATKAGVAGKTQMSGSQRMAQNAFNKGGVAGPRKDSSGRNVSSASGKRK